MTKPKRPGRTGRNFTTLLDPHPNRKNFANLQPQLVRYLVKSNLARLRGRPDLEAAAEAELQHAIATAGKSTLKFDAAYAADLSRQSAYAGRAWQ